MRTSSFRRNLMRVISASLSSILVISLASPATAASWSDFDIPDTGIVVMQTGNTGFAVTPACQPRLLVTHSDGSQGSHTLRTSPEYFPELGLTGCFTELGKVQSSDSFQWWSASGTTPAAEMPIIELTNMTAIPGNKTISLSWDVSNNESWIARYWVVYQRESVGGTYAKLVESNDPFLTLNVVANADDWNIHITPVLKLQGRGIEHVLTTSANVLPMAPAAVTLQPGDNSLSVFFEPGINEPANIASYTLLVTPETKRSPPPRSRSQFQLASATMSNIRSVFGQTTLLAVVSGQTAISSLREPPQSWPAMLVRAPTAIEAPRLVGQQRPAM